MAGLVSADSGETAHQDAKNLATVRAANVIANAEWRTALAIRKIDYSEPRLAVLRRPSGHPGRGTGYGAGVIVIDLDHLQRLSAQHRLRFSTMAVVVVAHELAHHMQFILDGRAGGFRAAATGVERELQADCLAGWSIGQANIRSRRVAGAPSYTFDDDVELQALFSPISDGGNSAEDAASMQSHGTAPDRIAAFRRGLTLTDFEACRPER